MPSLATCIAWDFKSICRYSAAHVVTPSARTNERVLSTHGHVGASDSLRHFISHLSLDDKNFLLVITRYYYYYYYFLSTVYLYARMHRATRDAAN